MPHTLSVLTLITPERRGRGHTNANHSMDGTVVGLHYGLFPPCSEKIVVTGSQSTPFEIGQMRTGYSPLTS